MTTKPIGIYVHIPVCLKKCNYCDFCSFKADEIDWLDKYIDALCDEIRIYANRGLEVDSIFFGGGTPSLLSKEHFVKIVNTIRSTFTIKPEIEFTLEANPKTIAEDKLKIYRSCGVNRISIGLQSIHENEMKILGRVHNYQDFLSSYHLVKQSGIDNINVDIMYGIPEQTISSFSETLDSVLALSPTHLSLYGLIIEEGTPFGDNVSSLNLPDEDTECDMYELACKKMAENGFEHYEISNYARDGRYSSHNLKYWLCKEYIGFGLTAYSYIDGRRYGNSDDINEYLKGKYAYFDSGDIISKNDEAYEFVMLALRLSRGFSLTEYRERFGLDFRRGREDKIKSLLELGYMNIVGDRLFLTEKGFYVSNNILADLI